MAHHPWQTVRVTKEVRIFGKHPDSTTLYDERSNYKQGTTLVIAEPEQLTVRGEQRAACRVLKKDEHVVALVAYVIVSDFGDKALLQNAMHKLGRKKPAAG